VVDLEHNPPGFCEGTQNFDPGEQSAGVTTSLLQVAPIGDAENGDGRDMEALAAGQRGAPASRCRLPKNGPGEEQRL